MEETKIKIKGKTYKIQFVDCLDLCCGLTNVETKTISIDNNLEKGTTFEAIVHELIHAYFYECGLDEYFNDEKLVTFIARHFFDVNKAFAIILERNQLNNGGNK